MNATSRLSHRVLTVRQLWNQLRLEPTTVEASSVNSSALDLITLSLNHIDQNGYQLRRCLHKLGTGVPFYDVKPPTDIPTRAIEVVHLAMSVSRKRKRKRRKVSIRAADAVQVVSSSAPAGSVNAELDWSDEELLEPEVDEHLMGGAGVLNPDDLDELLLADFEVDQAIFEVGTGTPCGEALNELSFSSPQSARLLKRSSSTTEPNDEDEGIISSNAILQLVGPALRLAISDAPKRLAKGVKPCKSKAFTQLANLAPSLWSPSYLSRVSSRAVFLPTISHALANVAGKATTSASLRSKVAALSPLTTGLNDDHGSVRKKLSIRLWYLLQAGLYDQEAARRLKPICFNVASDGASEDEALDILNASQQSEDLQDLELEDDFEADLDNFDGDKLFENDLFEPLWHVEAEDYASGVAAPSLNALDSALRLEQPPRLLNEPRCGWIALIEPAGLSPAEKFEHDFNYPVRGTDIEDNLLSVCDSVRSPLVTADGDETIDQYVVAEELYAKADGEMRDWPLARQSGRFCDAHGMLAI